jgi:6-pyruvoyltetrahydropterin/6-carboxytetrahydropterin synthase
MPKHMPTAILTRREIFCASHRLLNPNLSEEENWKLFDKCYRPNGHGHNYMVEVSVRGPIDENGLVMNLTKLKEIMDTHVMSKVDHRHLNLDVPEFATLNPTVENIAVVFWKWLQPVFGKLLYEIRIYETDKNFSVYRGES